MKDSEEEFELAKLINKKAKILKQEAKKAKKDQKLNVPRQFTEWQNPLCEWLQQQQPLSEWYVQSG